jgi:hypothetical protein
MRDRVLRSEIDVYCWDGPKPKMTLAGAQLGTLVLTERYLLFLCTSACYLGRRSCTATIDALSGEPVADETGTLDVSALVNSGSFAVPLHRVDEARPAMRWDRTKYLSLWLRDDSGAPFACALTGRLSMPDPQGWAQNVGNARAAAYR